MLSCIEPVEIASTLPDIAHAEAVASYLTARQIRLFDLPQCAAPLRQELRTHAERVAREAGLTLELMQRKEAGIETILAPRGPQPGLVHIFAAMDPCRSFRPGHENLIGRTLLKSTESTCLHCCLHVIGREVGLCYLRVLA